MNRERSVTVVIPFYNSSETLDRALRSVAEQTHGADEVIVVDDQSIDEQHAALREILRHDYGMPLHILRQDTNSGPAAARNSGWEAARSTWIAFLDSDDSWHPQRLELQLSVATPDTIMVGADSLVLHPGEPIPATPTLTDVPVRRLGLRHHLTHNHHTTSSVLLRRDIPARFTEGRYFSEDYELWIKVSSLGKVLKLRTPLSYFYKPPFGPSGLSSRIWQMILGEQYTFLLLRREGVISFRQFIGAELIMVARVTRRLLLIGFRSLASTRKGLMRG